ncbi:DNA polymerase [Candidatus Dependentiae bacterium]|nr:DNA polymerase [Candidatus Dependentiae bacterium]
MRNLSIDIETYSSTDLSNCGVYKYVEAPDFEILLFAYAFDNEPVQLVDLASGEQLPADVLAALTDPNVKKTAHNANFERTCIAAFFGITLLAEQWECTMVKSAMLGLPMSLEHVAKALRLEQEKGNGKALIRFFSLPCKPTKANGMRYRNLPHHEPAKWQDFRNYCVQDVVVERSIRNKISFFTIPPQEKKLWELDQRINDEGVLLDPVFIGKAIEIDTVQRTKLTEEAIRLTGLDNPNSAAQLKQWIGDETGGNVASLTKEVVPLLLEQVGSDDVKRVLQIRQELAKTSVKKYEAMLDYICLDNRVRGLIQFYGAGRTGRFAGRGIQVHNLPRMEDDFIKSLDVARSLVLMGDAEIVEMIFGNVPDTLSQLIRTAFIAPEGSRFIVSDFSAIEARVIAWLAGEVWRLGVFRTHGKIYEASAAQMFKVPIESIKKGSPLRQKGKVAELALGYQGGPNALIKMGALKMGLVEEELPKLVKMWRNANRNIVSYWDAVGNAAIEAVDSGEPQLIKHGIRFFVEKDILFIELPSKRRLAYMSPRLVPGKYGPVLVFMGMNQTTKQWGLQETYGGKLVENIVQAVARDCLAEAMLRLDAAGYKLVMHVHDEVVLEMPYGKGSTEEVNHIMSQPMPWAKDLPLTADSYETVYYKKD